MDVSTQKSKYSRWFKLSLVSRGKVAHLLKRSTKLPIQRKAAKTYELNFENFDKELEAKEENDIS